MALPQVVVVGLLLSWGAPIAAGIVTTLLAVQTVLMVKLLADPRGRAPWYNGTGVSLFVLGMMVTAVALRSL
jgi:chlorophyll synthase